MEDFPDPRSKQERWKEFRESHKEQQKEDLESLRGTKLEDCKILEVLIHWPPVNMKEVTGTEDWIEEAHDRYYANMHYLQPKICYPPGLINNYGKDMAQQAQGIYYYNSFEEERMPTNRNLFIPSFKEIDWDTKPEIRRRERARIIETHNVNNETFHKSEYAWEADAWSDVFGIMRNDNQLVIDKHECNAVVAQTDPINCTLTGESSFVKKIPDATFGLTTYATDECGGFNHTPCDYRHCPSRFPGWNTNLRRDKLEKLLLHRKCGLLPDPKWGDTDLAFPFMVYEAKGWSGDCREGRRQACLAAATYLDMLDDLSRKPGPVGTPKLFQTDTSHDNQVFALTNLGAHWHVLVGFKRGREKVEFANMECMSRNVYVFQKIWSARVINERSAWELLSLVDQIHEYAVTRFRNFVLQHLRAWHEFCKENYLLDWGSKFDVPTEKKRKRACSEGEDLRLPSWTEPLSKEAKERIQVRAKQSLANALDVEKEDERRLKVIKRTFPGRRMMEDVTEISS